MTSVRGRASDPPVAIRTLGCTRVSSSEVPGLSMDEPQAEQLVETLDRCGAPRAAGGADTSLAWYQLRARKRATFAQKS